MQLAVHVLLCFGALLSYLLEFLQHSAQSHKFGEVHLDPLWPAFSSRVSRWTAFILIAPDKCFPWHTISPSSPLFVVFHMPKHFNDTGFQVFSGLAELMKQGSYRAEQSADPFFFWKAKHATERQDLEESDKGHVVGLFRDSLVFLPF